MKFLDNKNGENELLLYTYIKVKKGFENKII